MYPTSLSNKGLRFLDVGTQEECRRVSMLASEIWTEHYTPIIGREQVNYMLHQFQSPSAIQDHIREGYHYVLIRCDGIDIGYLSYQIRTDHLFLSKVYLLKEMRGKGYGREAVAWVEGTALKAGVQDIVLTVNKYNTSSIHAYENLGFTNEGSIIQDIGGGFVMDDFKMKKSLDGPQGKKRHTDSKQRFI